jgi:GntR family transcriptional regulator/MocR family aminotransferase
MNQSALQLLSSPDRKRAGSLTDQIEERLRTLIDTGALREGERLPSTRELAAALGVNRGILLKAVRRLEESGRLKARVGSGITVVGAGLEGADPDEEVRFSSAIGRLTLSESLLARDEPVFADFSRLTPDEKFFPQEAFLAILADSWKHNRELWQYAPPYGFKELRVQIARRMSQTGSPWSADDILVTSGAQQALDLLFKTFVDVGDAVAVESPTYSGVLPLLQFYGARRVEIPVVADGRDLSGLKRGAVRLVYTMPERHNPTGETLDEPGRRELAAASLSAGAIVLEDGYETAVSGHPPLSALNRGRVVTLGSFSKDLAPGFRVGWIAADRAILRAVALAKQTSDLQTPLALQVAIAEFLRQNADEEVRRRRSREVEKRRAVLEESLERNLPELGHRGGGPGNPLFWLQLPPGVAGREVARRALSRGVRVAPGADFDPAGRDLSALRLSVSRIDGAVIAEGAARLAKAIRETGARSASALAIPTI